MVVLLGQASELGRAKAQPIGQVQHVGYQVHESGLVVARAYGALPGADHADRISWAHSLRRSVAKNAPTAIRANSARSELLRSVVWCIVPPSMALTVNTAGSPPRKAADVANGSGRDLGLRLGYLLAALGPPHISGGEEQARPDLIRRDFHL